MDDAHHKAMALADGELDSADLPALVHRLDSDGALMRWTQRHFDLRRNRLVRVYAGKRDEPVPQFLLDTVATGSMGGSRGASVLAYGGALFDRLRERYRMPAWSLAAGPAFAAALAVAVYSSVPPASGLEPRPGPQVEAALESVVGTNDPSVPALTIGVTYLSDKGTWCRQYDTRSGSQQTSALACRQNDGRWHVVVQMPPTDTALRPASPMEGPLGEYMRAHTAAPPLDSNQQQGVIASGWQRPAAK